MKDEAVEAAFRSLKENGAPLPFTEHMRAAIEAALSSLGKEGWSLMPRGGVEPDYYAESAKQYRRFRKLRKAAQAVVDRMGEIHDKDPWPLKYRAPFGAIADLANLLATFPDYPLPAAECPECHKYAGKCPHCHRPRPLPAALSPGEQR